jgi:hypothetical protein
MLISYSWANVTSQFVVGDPGLCYHYTPVFDSPIAQAPKKVIGSVSIPRPSIATTIFNAKIVFGIQLEYAFVLTSPINCAAAKGFSVAGGP